MNKEPNIQNADATTAYFMAERYYNGSFGVKPDHAEAAKWYARAAEQGQEEAQLKLAELYYQGDGIGEDHDKAAELLKPLADKGNGKAELRMYHLTDSMEESLGWLRRAVEHGSAAAAYRLGCCYEEGIDVEQDMAKAFELYKKGAEGGDCDAQYALVNCYEYGIGTEKDPKKAWEWLKKSAEGNNVFAIATLNAIM